MNPTKNLGLTHRYVDIVRNLEQCSIRLYLQLFVGRLVVYGHSSSRICGGICRVHDQQFVECPHCTSSFTRERDLRRHVSNSHRDINRPTSGGRSGERSRSPIRAQRNARPSVNQLSKMNPKSYLTTRKPEYYIQDTGIPSKLRRTVETVSRTGIILP